MGEVGNRVFTEFRRPSCELLEKFRGIPSSNINDTMNRLFCMHEYIQLMTPNAVQLLGPAFTVKVPIGDNLYFHKALDMALPGDVLVIDAGSGVNRSIAGEIMLRLAQDKGFAGVIIDGCIRDREGIQHLSMPVYARGVTPQGPYKNGPGEINTPVSCGGQVIFPGDLLVGDADGIVVIHPNDAPQIAEKARFKKEDEDNLFEQMRKDPTCYIKDHVAETESYMDGKKVDIITGKFTF